MGYLCDLVQIITQFKEQGLNTKLYYKNKEMGETYSIVPTNAIRWVIYLFVLVTWCHSVFENFSNEAEAAFSAFLLHISGEGVPDLLLLLVQWAQKTMVEKLTFSNEIEV